MRKQELMFGILKQLSARETDSLNFEDPEKARHKVNFDNLTPLYPDE